MKGYVQVYTGNGKGKTTAALGLAVRAAGAGLEVFIAQFIKNGDYSEVSALKRFADKITIRQFGLGRLFGATPEDEDIMLAGQGFIALSEALSQGSYDLVIADEINVAVAYGLIKEKDILDLIDLRPDNVELVLTGRKATEAVQARADLVTEMTCVKHYFEQGVAARTGIEK